MKQNTVKIIKSAVIFAVTLAAGFIITAVSFNLFGELSRNQMRLIFAIDVILLAAIGAAAHFFFDGKRKRKQREKELKERHDRRVKTRQCEMSGIRLESEKNKFAA